MVRSMERRHFIKTLAVGTAAASAVSATAVQAAAPASASAQAPASAAELDADIAGDLLFSRAEYDRRHRSIRAAMEQQGIDCLVVGGNREWREGELGNLRYVGVDIDWEPTYVILPKQGTPIVPSKQGGMTPPFVSRGTVEFEYIKSSVRPGTRNANDHAPAIARQLKKMGLAKGRIGLVSPRVLPAEVLLAMQRELPGASFVDAERLFLELRYRKSDEELKFLRRSAYCADKGIEAMIAAAQVGNTDWDLFFAMDRGSTEAGAPPGGQQLLNTGPWRGRRSNVFFDGRTARTLRPGDVIIPEVTSNYKGYFTQLTVPVVLGEPSEQFLADLALCDAVYTHLLARYRPGATVKGLDDECAEFTQQASDGAVTTLFGFQAGEHETTFWHDNITLAPGMLAYNQPFFIAPGGPPWHVYGDAMICTEGEPLKLHQTPMQAVYV